VADKTLVMPITAQYVLLELALPGRSRRNVGVLLLDPGTGRLYKKLRKDWDAIASPEDAEVLRHLDSDFQARIGELGGAVFLESLEDTLSNVLEISPRERVAVTDFRKALARLYEEHVEKINVIPFETHLPLYSLRAAASKFGQDMEVEEEDWIEAPEHLRLTKDMFVARVVGRSMEPVIRDGSLCVFRAGVVGSRQGKNLLVQQIGATESGAEFTVKRYTSKKAAIGEDEWWHEQIRLEPLNPDFEPMVFGPEDEQRRFRVIAEFVEVLN